MLQYNRLFGSTKLACMSIGTKKALQSDVHHTALRPHILHFTPSIPATAVGKVIYTRMSHPSLHTHLIAHHHFSFFSLVLLYLLCVIID